MDTNLEQLGFSIGDDGALVDDDQQQQQQQPPADQKTPEQIEQERKDAEAAALRQDADRWKAFGPVLEALEKRLTTAPQQQQSQPEQHQQQQQLTPEQLKKVNEDLTKAVLAGEGLQFVAAIAQQIAQTEVNKVVAQAQPALDRTGETFVDSYKARKTNERYFKAFEKAFDEECRDLPGSALLRMTPDQRIAEMDRRWNAAVGRVLTPRLQAAPRQAPPNLNQGTSFGSSQQQQSVLSDKQKAIMARSGMKAEEIAAFETDLREGRA